MQVVCGAAGEYMYYAVILGVWGHYRTPVKVENYVEYLLIWVSRCRVFTALPISEDPGQVIV